LTLVLDGKKTAEAMKGRIIETTQELRSRGITCGLAIILVGDDPASCIYANRLVKLGDGVGIRVELNKLAADATESELQQLVGRLNQADSVQGILPMMPLPAHLSAEALANAIDPGKDVDAVNPVNAGLVAVGRSRWAPCTPRAVMAILDFYQIPLAGRSVAIVGRSNVVGKPLFHLLLARDATVTVCHSRTPDLAEVLRQADIVVAAAGKPGLVKAAMVKNGAVVIDVGINEVDGKITGDVDYEDVAQIAAAITPVPGGVGAVSTIMVMEAVVKNHIQ
jgi:methylenetetrahydrofolate dehydrogenase (NADP+)/methenyltetrahydrofolate cyclohydrolase